MCCRSEQPRSTNNFSIFDEPVTINNFYSYIILYNKNVLLIYFLSGKFTYGIFFLTYFSRRKKHCNSLQDK